MVDSSGMSRETKTSEISWLSVLTSVKLGRRPLRNMSVANTFAFEPSSIDGQVRLYALGKENLSQKDQTLVYTDVPHGSLDQTPLSLTWKNLIQPSQEISLGKKLTRDEELQQERMRIRCSGIAAYESDPVANCITFTAGAQVFRLTSTNMLDESNLALFQPSPDTAPLNVTVCPSDASLVAFVCSGDIYIQYGSQLHRATHASSLLDSPTFAGTPAFVYQEEFDRFLGFWWEPNRTAGQPNIHYLLYEETDESEVMRVSLCVPGTVSEEVEQMRYPRAGTTNAKSTLKLMRVTTTDSDQSNGGVQIETFNMQTSLFTLFPWAEYLVRVGWVPNGKAIWAQLMSRKQDRLVLVYVPVEFFMADFPVSVTILLEERAEAYCLHVHDHLYFTSYPQSDEISFIWCSEALGHFHLYSVTAKYVDPSAKSPFIPVWGPVLIGALKPITTGPWSIARQTTGHIDYQRGHIYFLGYKHSPVEQHLYVTSFWEPNLEPIRLTESGLSHMCDIQNKLAVDSGLGLFVDICTGFTQVPQCRVYRLNFDPTEPSKCPSAVPVAVVSSTSVKEISTPTDEPTEVLPELFSYTSSASGFEHFGVLFRTPKLSSDGKHPTIIYVYGGPNVQIVRNIYYGNRFGFQTFCELGFNVVVIDGRGSDHRGVAFEAAIQRRMGTIEVDDQVEGLNFIAQQSGCIDMSRVGVFGWSYGGYMALLCLAKRPDVFKVAVSGAPVTDWELYDTGYTERYMDEPKNNPEGYATASVITYAHCFPNQADRLLILHGLNDENVHFAHTAALISALMRAGKPYQLHISPSERHSARGSDAGDHVDATVSYFFLQNL